MNIDNPIPTINTYT